MHADLNKRTALVLTPACWNLSVYPQKHACFHNVCCSKKEGEKRVCCYSAPSSALPEEEQHLWSAAGETRRSPVMSRSRVSAVPPTSPPRGQKTPKNLQTEALQLMQRSRLKLATNCRGFCKRGSIFRRFTCFKYDTEKR